MISSAELRQALRHFREETPRVGFLLAPSWRRAGVLTDAELTELRYGGRAYGMLGVALPAGVEQDAERAALRWRDRYQC